MTRRVPSGKGGQSLVELALIIPLWAIFAFAAFQFAFLFLAQISVMKSARDAGRWLAVHPNTVDSDAIAGVNSRLPPNITAANLSISISPSCSALTSGTCPNRNPGQQIALTFSYDARSIIFLPPTFGFGNFVVGIPTAIAPYTIYVATEPP